MKQSYKHRSPAFGRKSPLDTFKGGLNLFYGQKKTKKSVEKSPHMESSHRVSPTESHGYLKLKTHSRVNQYHKSEDGKITNAISQNNQRVNEELWEAAENNNIEKIIRLLKAYLSSQS